MSLNVCTAALLYTTIFLLQNAVGYLTGVNSYNTFAYILQSCATELKYYCKEMIEKKIKGQKTHDQV